MANGPIGLDSIKDLDDGEFRLWVFTEFKSLKSYINTRTGIIITLCVAILTALLSAKVAI